MCLAHRTHSQFLQMSVTFANADDAELCLFVRELILECFMSAHISSATLSKRALSPPLFSILLGSPRCCFKTEINFLFENMRASFLLSLLLVLFGAVEYTSHRSTIKRLQ